MVSLSWLRPPSTIYPIELRERRQWVGAGDNKEPINPHTGARASTTDHTTWGTFEEASDCGQKYVGFVLTKEDPYICIDLDTGKLSEQHIIDNHHRIMDMAGSYTELSMSGKSYHIFVKAQMDAGRRDDTNGIEIYPHGRFIIMTGHWKKYIHIHKRQELIDYLTNLMPQPIAPNLDNIDSIDQTMDDDQIIEMGRNAVNGQKFSDLFDYGNWQPHYGNVEPDHTKPSCSNADLGLLNMLDLYTNNVEQVVRVFERSKLYRGDYMNNRQGPYIVRTLTKARAMNEAKRPAPIDPTALIDNGNRMREELERANSQALEASGAEAGENELPRPPGLVGDIADYIYSQAQRPIKEVALAGALALLAGLAGRQYTYSNSGLNFYFVLLAKTGRGKEAASDGIDTLINHIRLTVPTVSDFIGPSMFASGQALVKVLAATPCILSRIGEIGHKLNQWANAKASPVDEELQRVLLDIYHKSGPNGHLAGTAYSNSDKNTGDIYSPCLTILGDTTPTKLFDNLSPESINSGFLPRFTFIEYGGERPARNLNVGCAPNPVLVQQIQDFTAQMLSISANNVRVPVNHTQEGMDLLDNFDRFCDIEINKSSIFAELWNRAHFKALKLAALLAVGVRADNPVITETEASWAIEFTKHDIAIVASRFESGEVGEGDHRHEALIRKAIERYQSLSPAKKVKQYKVPKGIAEDENVIGYGYLNRWLKQRASIKNSKVGAKNAINNALDDMVATDMLVEINPVDRKQKYHVTSRLFGIGPCW